MTEYKVHRVRFVEFIPEAINCLAFEDCDSPRLAVSRQDGTIEIWSTVHRRWTKDFVIPSQLGRSIESLTWCKSRLFSSGLEGDITEWDLEKLVEKYVVDSNGGPVWSLAANHEGSLLAAGCEDGAVRLFSIESNYLELAYVLDKQEFRILSLAWSHCDSNIVTGSTDSAIQVYDLKSKRIISRISTDKIRDKSTLIWSVYLTKDMTIISGDSFGQTQFWDANVGTLLQSFKSHQADVLTICVNENEDTVYSSGIDSRITEFKFSSKDGNDYGEWRLTKKIKAVDHDIRSLAMTNNHIVAGGVDPRMIKFATENFDANSFVLLSPLMLNSPCCVASSANILVFPDKNILHLWKLPYLLDDKTKDFAPKKLLELKSCRAQHITSCDITSDGSVIVFADVMGLSAFKILYFLSDTERPSLDVSKIKLQENDLTGVQKLKITADGSKLVFASHNGIGVLNMNTDEDMSVTYVSNSHSEVSKGPWISLAINHESSLIAAVNSQGNSYVYSIGEARCVMKLPRSEQKPMAVAFQPRTSNLVQVSLDKTILIFDVETEKLDQWAGKLNEMGTLKDMPSKTSFFINIVFNPENSQEMFLQSENGFVKVNIGAVKAEKRNKRKRKHPEIGGDAVKVCQKYSSLLHLDMTAEKSLIIIERPLQDIIGSLPPALKVKKYGT